MKQAFVYIMANRKNGTTYLGVTSNLVQRAWQHRESVVEGFTKEHGCTKLVWFEAYLDIQDARAAELRMKKWKRSWKVRSIESMNPDWKDLWFDIVGRGDGIGVLLSKQAVFDAGAGVGPRPSPGHEG